MQLVFSRGFDIVFSSSLYSEDSRNQVLQQQKNYQNIHHVPSQVGPVVKILVRLE